MSADTTKPKSRLKRASKARQSRLKRQAVREALLAEPNPINARISAATGSDVRVVAEVRKQLVEEGFDHLARKKGAYDRARECCGGWTVPAIRHTEDEPYLAQARRFREIWPMRWS